MSKDGKRSPLNAGSRGMARNPADIYEQKESTTCKGCCHIDEVKIGGVTHEICSLGKGYGKRCRRYDERKPVRW
jgi:hypothetical protein